MLKILDKNFDVFMENFDALGINAKRIQLEDERGARDFA